MTQQALGQPGLAVTDFDQAIRLSPIFAAAFLARGVALRGLGQADRAASDLVTAHRLDPALAIPPP